jgi:hypothetical protein
MPGAAAREQLLVQFKRLRAGHPAWLRVTVADVPATTSLKACLANRPVEGSWRKETPPHDFTASGLPAARVALAGRSGKNHLVSETVAVRRAGRVYFFSGTFPDGDTEAREQVRQAVEGVTWEEQAVVAGR